MKIIIAIDPGQNGGIVQRCWKYPMRVEKMPSTETDIKELLTLLCGYKPSEGDTVVYLEKVHSMPKQGVSSTFKFGESYGFIKGVLCGLGVRVVTVTPQRWMAGLSLGTSKGMTKTQWKNKLKGEAQRLYPDQKVTLATADALLIYEYAKRSER